ncbi:hypothetical protein A3K86_18325 [Photobacterium jeanii]|uniref:Diguanylate cyclase n=1 Tax=Photobacterium jeanii TaxID=858640 RepID=A0A178K0W1_9GAMM|nr:GGDEF domain-containing protein [Photobacterium jeanii]OAN10940.1 hypothetical protein A3K86_18325 [Photobacterium jeanii]PST90456.1 diguanylate phosphodiesterase [Photobacterium jeanii]
MTLFKQLFRITLITGFLLISLVFVARFSCEKHEAFSQQHERIRYVFNLDLANIPQQDYDSSLAGLSSLLRMQLHPRDYQTISIAPALSQQQSLTITTPHNKSSSPAWFSNLFSGTPQSYSHTIHLAKATMLVTVSNNVKWLSDHLWEKALHYLMEAFAAFTVYGILLFVWLRRTLQPVQRLSLYAEQLEQNPQSASPAPRTRFLELNNIARSFQHLAQQLENHFRLQAKEAAHLREKAYRDPISHLGNREYFLNQLNAWLTKDEQGGLMLIQAKIINQSYRHKNFQKGDQLVRDIAETLNSNVIHSNCTLGRISKTEFAILLPQISQEKLMALAELLHTSLQPLTSEFDTPLSVTIGLAITDSKTSASQLLAQLDNALIAASQSPANPIAMSPGEGSTNKGKQYWHELVSSAIRNRQVYFHFQPVLLQNEQVYHQEVFSTVRQHDSSFSANQFIGALDELSQGTQFDKHVIVNCIKQLQAEPQLPPLAINLTRSSVQDPAFHRWLNELLPHHHLLCSRLFFEIQESCFVENNDMTQLLCQQLTRFNVGFGIDNFGRHFKSLEYLKVFKPAYVKIDFAFTVQLNNPAQAAVLTSISRTAHSLGIVTIATRVETETQLERLSELFVSGFQGFIIERQVSKHHEPLTL